MNIGSEAPILLVEDSDEDVELIKWAFRKLDILVPMIRCADGNEALDYLYHREEFSDPRSFPLPSLILLDLDLVSVDGFEVLQEIKKSEDLCTIPIVIWTTFANAQYVNETMLQGASSYILKPMNINRLLVVVQLLKRYWFDCGILPKTLPGYL
ncbi:response regulator [Dictyobacter aurantiacus]|uniref:Response regulator n=1 Tax=Dictyobacter aurantiacus TaxID=1936993 RepID=A0A401ZP62_9CHLR|nr:response regulator [Dictyobacter aurantiacus]GCE08632.1 response regulator [Dictyobacter aurantiacus]